MSANKHGIIEFSGYVGRPKKPGESPATIKAADLDNNFRRLTPINPDGKELFVCTDGGLWFQTIELDVCVDGNTQKVLVLGYGPY